MQKKSFAKNVLKGINKRIKAATSNPHKKVNLNWLKLKYLKHLPAGKLRKHRLLTSYVYFYNAPEFLHGLNEIFIEEIYKQELIETPYIIDCGANIGLSIIYLKHLYPKAEILAFEPDEKNYELLSKNISSFKLENVTLKKEAVWIEDTVLAFSNQGSMSSKIQDNHSTDSKEVKATRLRDLITKNVDFLKIDIEGAEFSVLSDLNDKLNLVKNLFVEYHGHFTKNDELTKLFAIFSEYGFSYYIKEAAPVYDTPFLRIQNPEIDFDIQLNIFCFRI